MNLTTGLLWFGAIIGLGSIGRHALRCGSKIVKTKTRPIAITLITSLLRNKKIQRLLGLGFP